MGCVSAETLGAALQLSREGKMSEDRKRTDQWVRHGEVGGENMVSWGRKSRAPRLLWTRCSNLHLQSAQTSVNNAPQVVGMLPAPLIHVCTLGLGTVVTTTFCSIK